MALIQSDHVFLLLVCVATFVALCFVLRLFVKRRKQFALVGMLFVHVLTCMQFSFTTGAVVVLRTIFMNSSFDSFQSAMFYVRLIGQTNQCFVFISGAILALDRAAILTFSLQYTKWKLNRKFVFVFLVASLLSAGPSVAISVILGDDSHGIFINSMMILELLLHIVFIFQYRKFSTKRNAATGNRYQATAHHITLFQAASLTAFGFVPHAIVFADKHFGDCAFVTWFSELSDMHLWDVLEEHCFTVYVFMTSCFSLFKMTDRRQSANVVTVSLRGRNS